jgi:hypothetical protein
VQPTFHPHRATRCLSDALYSGEDDFRGVRAGDPSEAKRECPLWIGELTFTGLHRNEQLREDLPVTAILVAALPFADIRT